jgi:intein/homing endonuclease
MLGDGYMKSSRFTTKDIEIVDEVRRTNSVKISIKERCRDIDKGNVLVKECLFDVCVYGITDKIKNLGLYDKKSDTKFIPSNYLFNSIENRVELLRGLLDTDGNVRKNGGIEYVSTSKDLIENVRWLVLSLGGFCKLSSKLPTYTYKGVKKTGKEVELGNKVITQV